MSNTKDREFGIVVNDEHEFSIWPTHRNLQPGWQYTGPTGTYMEMQEFLEQQFITTRAATYLRAETRFGGLAPEGLRSVPASAISTIDVAAPSPAIRSTQAP
jgi:uncharacterized protein YbdZ (MbtH family)